MKHIISIINKKLKENDINKIIKNILWLISDSLFLLLLQFFIGVKIANHYGSAQYGNYNYIVTFIGFSAILFELINLRVVKKYYEKNNFRDVIYNVTFFRYSISILITVFIIISKLFINIDNFTYLIFILLAVDNIFLTSTTGIENYYEYILESKKVVMVSNTVKIISSILQYIGIILNYSIIIIPCIKIISSIIRIIILKILFYKDYGKSKKHKIDFNLLKNIIKESYYLWLSYVAFLIYTHADKIMIGMMLGDKEVGIYSVGSQLSFIILIILSPIPVSIFPKMLKMYQDDQKKYLDYFLKINTLITQLYIFIIISSIFVLKHTFHFVFTSQYNDAVIIYIILCFSVLFKANGSLQTNHMTIKKITKKSFYKTFIGLIINIILNYLLISKYKIFGAAIATSLTHFITLFLIDFFIDEYKEQAIIQLKSFNISYLFKIFKK